MGEPESDPRLVSLQKELKKLPHARHLRLLPYDDPRERGTRVVVDGLCKHVQLRLEDPETPAEEPPHRWAPRTLLNLTSPDVATGDADFDRAFHLVGSPPLLLALLGEETRQALGRIRWGPVPVSEIRLLDGELRLDVVDEGPRWRPRSRKHRHAVEQVARLALEMIGALHEPADVWRLLADNARRDIVPSVRLQNLTALVRGCPDHVVVHETLKGATMDPDPDMRLLAGIELRDEGLSILEGLASSRRVEDGCSARAVEALGPNLTTARASGLLREALGPRAGIAVERPLTAGACVDLLERRGEVAALRFVPWANGAVGLSGVKALERIGGAAENALASALSIPDEERAVAIVKALGAVGSVAAVAALKEAARRGGKLKGAARQAIAEIQARVHGTPGQLSLAEGGKGGLTLVDEQAGQLSLPAPLRDRAKS